MSRSILQRSRASTAVKESQPRSETLRSRPVNDENGIEDAQSRSASINAAGMMLGDGCATIGREVDLELATDIGMGSFAAGSIEQANGKESTIYFHIRRFHREPPTDIP